MIEVRNLSKHFRDKKRGEIRAVDGVSFRCAPGQIYGLLGAKLGWVEGVEVNVLGLVAGLDIRRPALKIPCVGRLGLDEVAVETANAQ